MQKQLGQRMYDSHGINLCFSNSFVLPQKDSSIEPVAGNVTTPIPSEKLSADSQAVTEVAEGIDIHGKSVQKPKRKKHRPKVIKEGQSANQKKTKTPDPPKEKANQSTGKRKYVRRKGLKAPMEQPPSGGADTHITTETGAAGRCFNFDGQGQNESLVLVSQNKVVEVPACPGDTESLLYGVERSNVQVSYHLGGTSSSIASVDAVADLQEPLADSMPKRVAFDLNNSIENQIPNDCSNIIDGPGQFFQFGSREHVQTNHLMDFHADPQVRSVSHLNRSVNHMQHHAANFAQYMSTFQSSTEKSPRHVHMSHSYRFLENLTAPSRHTETISMGNIFNPEEIRKSAIMNQMAQCYKLPGSPLVPHMHSERHAVCEGLNEFSVKNDELKFSTNDNYQTGAAFVFHDSVAIAKKREHKAISGTQISFNVGFDDPIQARQFYSDVSASASSRTSYFPETCKRMRTESHGNKMNGAMGKMSSSSAFSGSENTYKISTLNPGVCTLAEIQQLLALEKSRAHQQLIHYGMLENNMVRQHIKPAPENKVCKDFIAIPDKQLGSFTAQSMQLPGSTMDPQRESTITRNGINQIQPSRIKTNQHHSGDSFPPPEKWTEYITAGHTQLPSGTLDPSMESYVKSNAIHQLQSLENVMTRGPVLSETYETCTRDDTVNITASTDAQIRTPSAEAIRHLSQPSSQWTRNGNYHLDASPLTPEAKLKKKKEHRAAKEKQNVVLAKQTSRKDAYTSFLKPDGIGCPSELSNLSTPGIITAERTRFGEQISDVLKTSDQDQYSGISSKETHKGRIFEAASPSVDPLDSIIQKINLLNINKSDDIAADVPENALVPYSGKSGAVVAYEGKVKKSRSRAKVSLDPVTTLMWNLLMGPDMGDGTDGLDKDKEKWLDEERRVFRGRVDSFIARMHLVQGDRRFSPWKGSVVDSIVGVFLTQNVSDHLSSSAFMAVAAKFPAKSEIPEKPVPEVSDTPREQNDSCFGLFGDSTKLQGKLSIEEISDIRSLITTEDNEDSNSNDLFGRSSGNRVIRAAEGCSVLHRKSPTGYHENGAPGSVFPMGGFSSVLEAEDGSFEDIISSQNSAVSSQNSPDYLFHRTDPIGSISLHNSNGIGYSTEFTVLPPVQDTKSMFDGNSKSSEYNGVNLLPISGVNKGVLLDLNRSYLPVHGSTSYFENDQPDPTGVSCFSYVDKSLCAVPDRVNLYSRTQSESSPYQLPLASADNRNTTKITDLSSHFLYSTNGSVGQETMPCPSEPSQQGDFSPIIRQNFKPVHSTENVKFSKENSFCESQYLRNKPDAPFVEPHDCSNIKDAYTTPTKETGHAQFQSGYSQQDNDVRVQTTSYENDHLLNLCENQNSDSVVLQGVVSDSAQKFRGIQKTPSEVPKDGSKAKKVRGRPKKEAFDWDSLRKEVLSNRGDKQRSHNTRDTVDWEAVRQAEVREISETIRERGMNNMLAERIKEFLNRLVRDHGSIDLEWLREVQPDKAKDFLLSIRGLGLKSVECVRLLTLHHMAFPVDTNVGRICVRLGWVPLQPLPESLQLHLLEMYPMLEHIQKYLWPRLCKLDQRTLYELHYQMITFGKVFCTKSKPNCNSCPMRAECKHFASAFASARLALPAPEEKNLVTPEAPNGAEFCHQKYEDPRTVGQLEWDGNHPKHIVSGSHQPIIEEPPSPEPEPERIDTKEDAIEDLFCEDPDEIPTINLNIQEFTRNLKHYMQANNIEIEDSDMSNALVAITPEAASIPTPKLKNISRLRTEHQVYELPDSHPLLEGFDPREPDDPFPYLLSIWTPGETAQSTDAPKTFCNSEGNGKLCGTSTCFSCNSIREMQAQKVRGTLLIPCRTAMRGSFPLNGTYFQVNEVFADHYSSQNPIDVPRSWIWNLPRRTVYFGTSVPTIFRGLTTEEIQQCFWRGFVCVRGFDRTSRAPKPLYARLHFPASKVARGKKPRAARDEE